MALTNPCQGSTANGSAKDWYTANRGPSDLPQSVMDVGRSKCFGDRPVVTITQGQKTRLVFWASNPDGTTLDLSGAGPFTVRFIARTREQSPTNALVIVCDIDPTDGAKGKITCDLPGKGMERPGLFPAQLGVYDADDNILFSQSHWLMVNPGLDYRSNGPITIPEVRLMLRDSCPEQNFLIDDFEFTDDQIVACIRLPVDEFNEKYQPKTNFGASNFPYRFHWLRGATGYLMEIASKGYARNHLDYSAGGVNVQDKNKFGVYAAMSKDLLAEWRQFIKERKVEMNIEGGFGNMGSGYRFSTYR